MMLGKRLGGQMYELRPRAYLDIMARCRAVNIATLPTRQELTPVSILLTRMKRGMALEIPR